MKTEANASWRKRLLARHQDSELLVNSDVDQTPSTDDSWLEASRRQLLETMQEFDASATLSEELSIRLVGEAAQSAALPMDWSTLIRPLQTCVNEFTSEEVKLEISGFSKGSTVLHVRAIVRDEVDAIGHEPVQQTVLSAAVVDLLRMITAAEGHKDLRRWKTKLYGFERLVDELESFDLTAGFRWSARGGAVRSSRLTESGMEYIKGLRKTVKKAVPVVISGRITELRASGHVKVKAAPHKSATAWDVSMDAGQLTAMKLVLGQEVSWIVEQHVSEDRLHRIETLGWSFKALSTTADVIL